MSLASYSELITVVTEYLAREEDAPLIARIPTFIALAESKFNRSLRCRQMENRASASVNLSDDEPEFIQLPLDFQSMRRVRMSNIEGKPRLNYMSAAQVDEYRTSTANVSGRPIGFTVFGSEMELVPTPDEAITLEMTYRATIPALSADNTTNWLLAQAPDAYLYGTLLETAPYIKEDARISTWGSGLSSVMEGLNKLSEDALYNAGPLQMRVSGRIF